MSEVQQVRHHWQDSFNNVMGVEGTAFRAEKENFPKLWIKEPEEYDSRFIIFFSPTPGKVYMSQKNGELKKLQRKSSDPMGPGGEKLNSQELVQPSASSSQPPRRKKETLSVYWKETEPEEKLQSCLVYYSNVTTKGNRSSNTITYKFWDFGEMMEINSPETEIFSCGIPLNEAKWTNARYGAYTSTDWGKPQVVFGGGSIGGIIGDVVVGAVGGIVSGLTGLFSTADAGMLPPEYGSAECYPGMGTTEHDNSIMNGMSLPGCLQSRAELFPLLERIKLKNAKNPELEHVYQFRLSSSESMFFSVSEARLVEQSDLQKDKPSIWYLLEDPQDGATGTNPCYVLGIGHDYVRVHSPDDTAAIEFKIFKESEIFPADFLSKSTKERTARKPNEGKGGSMNMTAGKIKRVTEEIVTKVSYKTICAIMHPISPDGRDVTVRFFHEVNREMQEVHLVLYAVNKKHVKYLGTIGNKEEEGQKLDTNGTKHEAGQKLSITSSYLDTLGAKQEEGQKFRAKQEEGQKKYITLFVGVWNDYKLVDGYWASAEETLADSMRVVDEVKMVMQMRGVIPSDSLIRAELDVESPNLYFLDIPGEYGAAFRLACVQEYERNKKKCSSDPAYGGNTADVAQLVAKTAESVAKAGYLGETAKNIADTHVISSLATLAADFFGLSSSEPYGPEVDIVFGGSLQVQPFEKIVGIYDQGRNDICVLCSIGHAISMVAPPKTPEGVDTLEYIKKSLSVVFPLSAIPRGGLNITNTLTALQDVLLDYDLDWKRIRPTVTTIKNALDNGIPIIAGIKFDQQLILYENNLDQPISGPKFGPGMHPFMHCVTIVAYDDADSTFTALNSYDSSWGRNGAMIIEQEYRCIDRAFILEKKVEAYSQQDISAGYKTTTWTMED